MHWLRTVNFAVVGCFLLRKRIVQHKKKMVSYKNCKHIPQKHKQGLLGLGQESE
jgi:hypothetical protein